MPESPRRGSLETEGRRTLLRRFGAVGVGTLAGTGLMTATAPDADAAGSGQPPAKARKATARRWARRNPVLASGLLAWATDTHVLKIGDGIRRWSSLPAYVSEDQVEEILARRIGGALVVSATQPAAPTKFGLPVIWIDPTNPPATDGRPGTPTSTPTAIPTEPSAPAFDDVASTYYIPEHVVGVDYLVDGVVKSPGNRYPAPQVPGQVTVVARARQGYTLLGDYTFAHDFPDPDRITVLTSDTFTGPAGPLRGRTNDTGLGGAALTWSSTGAASSGSRVEGGRLVSDPASDGEATLSFPGVRNLEVTFDLLELESNGRPHETPLVVTFSRKLSVQLGDNRFRVQCANFSGGSLDLQFGLLTPAPLGRWTLRCYGRAFSIVDGSGTTRTWDIDPAVYDNGTGDEGSILSIRSQCTQANGQSWALDDIVVKKVGF